MSDLGRAGRLRAWSLWAALACAAGCDKDSEAKQPNPARSVEGAEQMPLEVSFAAKVVRPVSADDVETLKAVAVRPSETNSFRKLDRTSQQEPVLTAPLVVVTGPADQISSTRVVVETRVAANVVDVIKSVDAPKTARIVDFEAGVVGSVTGDFYEPVPALGLMFGDRGDSKAMLRVDGSVVELWKREAKPVRQVLFNPGQGDAWIVDSKSRSSVAKVAHWTDFNRADRFEFRSIGVPVDLGQRVRLQPQRDDLRAAAPPKTVPMLRTASEKCPVVELRAGGHRCYPRETRAVEGGWRLVGGDDGFAFNLESGEQQMLEMGDGCHFELSAVLFSPPRALISCRPDDPIFVWSPDKTVAVRRGAGPENAAAGLTRRTFGLGAVDGSFRWVDVVSLTLLQMPFDGSFADWSLWTHSVFTDTAGDSYVVDFSAQTMLDLPQHECAGGRSHAAMSSEGRVTVECLLGGVSHVFDLPSRSQYRLPGMAHLHAARGSDYVWGAYGPRNPPFEPDSWKVYVWKLE